MNGEKLNILIRTSHRPNYFKRLIATIERQTYRNINLVVSADSDETALYVEKAGYKPVIVDRLERSEKLTFPWNLYLNKLMASVDDGWIVFVDDDDMLAGETVVEQLMEKLADPDSMMVFRMRFPDGRVVPGDDYWGKVPFTRKQIAMPCFAFNSKWKSCARFDGQRAGDFRFINGLADFIGIEWLDLVVVQLDNFGNVGKRIDLK
jgi:glycosyltransferase involved in cell wall biosynthesis